jgi:integrase
MAFLNQYKDEGTVKTGGQKEMLNSLRELAKDASLGKAKEVQVYQKAEKVIKKHPYLAGTINAIVNKELNISFDVGKDKEIGFSISPEEKKTQLGFKWGFNKGGFLNKYQEKGKVVSLEAQIKGDITIGDAFDDKIQDFRDDLKAAKRLNNEKVARQATKTIKELLRNKKRLLDIIDASTTVKDLNNLDVIRDTLEKASKTDWWIESSKGEGAAARNFYRDISRSVTKSIGKENNKWNTFRKLGVKSGQTTGPQYQKLIKYTPEVAERAVVFNNAIFKTVVQSLDDIPDLNLENIPQGSTSRFAKISALTGMRPANLAEVTLNDINFKNGTISYIDKAGKKATVSVNKTALALFEQQKQANIAHGIGNSRTVFVGTAVQYSKPINKHLKTIGAYVQEIDTGKAVKFQLYDFRRLQKARLIANEQPQWVIDKLQGHSYKGSYSKGIMEQGLTNADVRKIVIDSEIDFYNRAGYSGDAIKQFSGSDIESKPRVRIKAGTQPPDDLPPPTGGGTGEVKQKIKTTAINDLPEKWGGKFLKYAKTGGKWLARTAAVVLPLEQVQALNVAAGGEEGVLPTDEEGRILGFVEPTPQREAKAISELFNIPVYPEGHPKEGQHILSTKEYKEMQMPEELEQFEQQSRF